jgi:hypothetical protein
VIEVKVLMIKDFFPSWELSWASYKSELAEISE